MFSLKLLKITFVAGLLAFGACGLWQSKTEVAPTISTTDESISDVPFATKEPENFQAEIVVTANNIEDKFFAAKNGANQLTIFDYQKNSEFALLKIGGNQSFLINRRQKIYAESESAASSFDQKNEFLTNEWLNQKTDAKFEKLGSETDLTKYRVRLNDSPNTEIIVSVDEKINFPVKQEFYSVNGEQKTLTMTTELKNFNAPADAKFFEVPKDYKKVSPKEFQEMLRRERILKND